MIAMAINSNRHNVEVKIAGYRATTVVHQRLATKMKGYRWATTGLHVAHSC
jgi:hypothetical protein